MNLKTLTEQKTEKQTEMENLLNKIEEEKRAFTEEENALFDELEKEISALSDTISKVNKGRELSEVKEDEKESESTEDSKEDEKEEGEEKVDKETERAEERAFANYIRGVLTAEERADVNLTVGENGDIIPTTIAKKIIKQVYDISPILEKSTKYNVKGKLEIPYYSEDNDSKIAMAYHDEFKDLESNIGKFKTIELTGFLAGTFCKLSRSLINNTDYNLVQEVINLMAETIAVWTENELINGTADKISGLANGVTQSVSTASATAITSDDVVKLRRSVKQRFQKNAIWIMNPTTLTAISLLKDDNGRYLLQDDINNDFGYTLLGKPVYESDNMPEIGSGNTIIYFGDMSGLATKSVEELEIEVLREKFATQHAVGIVAWTEFDAKVEDAQKISKLVCGE